MKFLSLRNISEVKDHQVRSMLDNRNRAFREGRGHLLLGFHKPTIAPMPEQGALVVYSIGVGVKL